MDRNKVREEIARIIETENAYGYYAPDRAVELADSILSLLAPVIEKAERWEKVEEIAERNWTDDPCEDCPVAERCDSCNSLCGQADSVVEALKEPL